MITCPILCCTEWIKWKGTKCYDCNFFSLKEGNNVQHLVARVQGWAYWRATMELRDDSGDGYTYVQAVLHICHQSSALKLWIGVSLVRQRGGIILLYLVPLQGTKSNLNVLFQHYTSGADIQQSLWLHNTSHICLVNVLSHSENICNSYLSWYAVFPMVAEARASHIISGSWKCICDCTTQ